VDKVNETMEVVDIISFGIVIFMFFLMVFISKRTIRDSNIEIDAIKKKYDIIVIDERIEKEIRQLNKMC